MGEFTKKAGIALVFIILAALYFLDVLSGEYLLTERDLNGFFIPPRLFWMDVVKHGSFPFWNPYYESGHPLFATLQPGVFYPFSLFYLFLPFAVAFNNTIVLHFALAGIFTYLLMRAQKASHAGAFISGFCFIFGGYLISVHSLLSTLLSVVWTPLFLLVYFSAFYKKNIHWSIWAGVVGTVMFLGGGVEVCFLIFPLVFLLSVFPGLLFEESQYPPLKVRLACFAVFSLTFAGLSAVQLLPFKELVSLSMRAPGFYYFEATTWSMHPADLITFFVPDLYGYTLQSEKYWVNQNWLKSIYLGSMPFLLSLFFFLKRERKSRTFILLILLSLVLAFGGHTLFYPFLYKYVPFFNQLRYPAKFIFLAIFLISLAAGFGYDRFREEQAPQRTRQLTKSIFGIGFASIVFFGVLNVYEEPIAFFCKNAGWDKPEYNDIYVNLANARRFLFFTGFFSLLLFLWENARSGKSFFAYAVIFVLTGDLFFNNHDFYTKTPIKVFMEPSSNEKFILANPSLSRVFVTKKTERDIKLIIGLKGQKALDINKEKIVGGLGLVHGIFSVSGAEVTTQARYNRLMELIYTAPAPDTTNLLNMLNMKYLVSIPPIKSPDYKLVHMNIPGDLEELEKAKTIKVYENLKVLPRAFLVGACYKVGSDEEYKDILSAKEFHPEQVVLLDKSEASQGLTCEKSAFLLPESVKDAGEVVDITDYQNNSVELRVKLNSKKFLFMSESYYPGWSALVDGKPETIYRANYVFRALLLEPGEHKIVFRYNPLSFKIGAAITLLTIMVCTVVLARKKL